MHYYPHNIGDFNNATRHLTRVERSVYRDAIERYYDTESPLPANDFGKLCKILLCATDEEKQALSNVLEEFFTVSDGSYHHERCDEEIAKYRANTSAKARAGKASAEAKKNKNQHVLNGRGTDEQLTNNQEPINNNQEPLKELVPTVLVETPEFQLAEHDQVQYEKIIDLYHKALPELPRVAKLTTTRRSHVRARWKNDLGDLGAWERFFMIVRDSSFLMGRAPPSHGRTKAFLADFDFLIKESNCIKIVEGKYRDQARRN